MSKLIVFSNKSRRQIELVENNTIGRHPKNRIQVRDRSVSKDHCQIFMNRTHGWMIKDLGSANGTFLNKIWIKGETVLNDGDEILLGNIRCVFNLDADSAAQMVEVSDDGLQSHIHTKTGPILQDRFLPAEEISDEMTLRSDYEKLRITHELQVDIGLEIDIDKILERILERTFEFLNCDRGVILLTNKIGGLEPKAYKTRGKKDKLVVSSTLIKQVQKERTGIISSDILTDSRFSEADSIILQGVRSTIAAPILYQQELLGIMIIDSSEAGDAFIEKDLLLITNIANQTALFIKNSTLHEELRLCFDSSIRTLSAMVDAKHPLTAGHSQRVTEYSMMIAEEMGLGKQRLEILKFAALLHDIGKIGIRDNVLLKDGSFTLEEKADMDTHPLKTKVILDNFRFPSALCDVPEIASYHHEKINGQGYPYGMTGEQLPLISKILVVADVFDALTAYRDYPKYFSKKVYDRDPLPLSKVIGILKDDAGSHFDPEVIDAFLRCLPKVLLRYRGGHFSPEYVDETIQSIAPELLNPIKIT